MHTQDAAQDRTILVLNSGSSSLKFGLFRRVGDDESLLLEGSAEGIGRDDGSLRIKAPDGRVLVQQERVLESQTDALQKLAQVLTEQHHARPVGGGASGGAWRTRICARISELPPTCAVNCMMPCTSRRCIFRRRSR